jgi:acyl-CoA synthetase (NDP forming)
VDTTAAVSAQQFRDCLRMVAEAPAGRGQGPPDAVIALTVLTAASDLVPVLQEVRLPVPLAAVVLDQSEAIRTLPGTGGGPAVPAYAYPEAAAGALGRAAQYGAWRSRPAGTVPEFADIRVDQARALVTGFLGRLPGGGWLSPAEADELLRCYGIPVVEGRYAAGLTAVLEAAATLGGHVVLKADVPGLVHKSDAGAVELGLRGPADVRRALRRLEGRFGDRLSGVLVQAMIPGGVETIIGVVQEPVFGPLVVFGLGGIATEVLGDHAARLAPLTGTDADDLIRQIRAAPLLLGHRGQPAADLGALRDTLLRVSRLADDLPQVAELDLNPVIARPDGVFAVDARVRLTSHRAADPFLRQLRMPPGEQRPEKEGVPQ